MVKPSLKSLTGRSRTVCVGCGYSGVRFGDVPGQDTGGHAVRKVYGVAQSYKTVHATRQDILSGTEKGRVAVSRFGQPDPDIMSGKKRSVFSPPLK